MDLRMPISRVRSMTAVYMDWKMTRKPMMTAMPMTTRRAMLKPGRRVGGHRGEHLFDGVDLVLAQAGVARISLRTWSWFAGSSVLR